MNAPSRIDLVNCTMPVTYVHIIFNRLKSNLVHRICETIRRDAIEQGRLSKQKHEFCQKRAAEYQASALIMEHLIHIRQLPLK